MQTGLKHIVSIETLTKPFDAHGFTVFLSSPHISSDDRFRASGLIIQIPSTVTFCSSRVRQPRWTMTCTTTILPATHHTTRPIDRVHRLGLWYDPILSPSMRSDSSREVVRGVNACEPCSLLLPSYSGSSCHAQQDLTGDVAISFLSSTAPVLCRGTSTPYGIISPGSAT